MILNRFLYINSEDTINELSNDIQDISIVFCNESNTITTHNEIYAKPIWKTL